jgi:hypothetical protein
VVYSSPDKQTVHVVLGGDDVSTRACITILLSLLLVDQSRDHYDTVVKWSRTIVPLNQQSRRW